MVFYNIDIFIIIIWIIEIIRYCVWKTVVACEPSEEFINEIDRKAKLKGIGILRVVDAEDRNQIIKYHLLFVQNPTFVQFIVKTFVPKAVTFFSYMSNITPY